MYVRCNESRNETTCLLSVLLSVVWLGVWTYALILGTESVEGLLFAALLFAALIAFLVAHMSGRGYSVTGSELKHWHRGRCVFTEDLSGAEVTLGSYSISVNGRRLYYLAGRSRTLVARLVGRVVEQVLAADTRGP